MFGPTSRPRPATSLLATLVALIAALSLGTPTLLAQDETGDFGSASPPPAQAAPAPAAETESAPAAQAEPAEAPPPAQPTAQAEPAATTTSAAIASPPPQPGPDMPAPIMVVVLTSGRVAVPEDVQSAARDAVIAQVTPMTGGRPVLPLMAPALRDAIAACTEPACIGGQIASAGAFGAILVRLSKRAARGPVSLTLEMVDPVSGSPRLTPLTGSLTSAASAATELQPLTAQLQGVMFSPPPPPPTLLVTVNVDGARVRVDETELGESPVARTTLRQGRHVVQVTRAGYVSSRRTIELVDGQNERLDVILSPSTAIADDGTSGSGSFAGGGGGTPLTEEPLFWVAIGGGVLVIAGIAIGVGVAVANSGPPPNPMGIPLPPIEP